MPPVLYWLPARLFYPLIPFSRPTGAGVRPARGPAHRKDPPVYYGVSLPNYAEYSDPRAIAEMAYEAEQAGWDGSV